MALSFTMASGHGFGPAHPRSLHPVLDEVLAGPLDRTTGDRQTCRQILVIAHAGPRSEEHTSELQSRLHLVCRLLLGKNNDVGHLVVARDERIVIAVAH